MDSKKKKAKSAFDVWPPPRKDKLEQESLAEKRSRITGFHDRYEDIAQDLNAPVFEGDEETEKQKLAQEKREAEELKAKTDPYYYQKKENQNKDKSDT